MVKTQGKLLVVAALVLAVIGNPLPAAAEVINRIVAIVNNEIITLSELNTTTKKYRENITTSQNSESRKKELIAKLESDMLNQMVERTLTTQEAKKYGIKVTDADVDRAIDNFKKNNNVDDEQLARGLSAEGLTMADYRNRMQEQIRQSMIVNRAVRSKIIITDEEVDQYYNDHRDQFTSVVKYKLRNIITKSEEQIKTVAAKLKTNVPFDRLAKEFSIGSNASDGGELGVFDISSFSNEIREAVQGLKKGEFTPVLKTSGGYQILFVEDIVTQGGKADDEVKRKIHSILYRIQGEKQFRQWMDSLKKKAHIKLML